MRSSYPLLSCLLASVASLALHSAASACDTAPQLRWNPERSWPAACESDVPTDGFVLLEGDALPSDLAGGEGQLVVWLERTVDGQAVEKFAGSLSFPSDKSALFHSEAPLQPNADYLISAERQAADGSVLGARYTSKFTTGALALAPVSFRDAPSVQLEQFDAELQECAADSCGVEHCRALDVTVPTTSVRVRVPAIEGGIAQRPYAVSASLSLRGDLGQAPAVATSDSAVTQAGKHSFVVVDVPHGSIASEACVTITATDLAGHSATSEPVCIALPSPVAEAAIPEQGSTVAAPDTVLAASSAVPPAVDRDQASGEPEFSQQVDALSADAVAAIDDAGGCAIGEGRSSLGGFGWVALALTLAPLRSRKRKF
jgi:hypothetical protein